MISSYTMHFDLQKFLSVWDFDDFTNDISNFWKLKEATFRTYIEPVKTAIITLMTSPPVYPLFSINREPNHIAKA